MANARVSALLARRTKSPYSSSGSIRLLSPNNSSISSIAKKVASSELDVMVSKYNLGLVSNQEMRDFLSKMQGNPGLTPSDKLNIDEQLRDFDSRIIKDKLENAYKAAPDNSLQQIQSLQALSNYWKSKAGTMQQDTPAYATAVDNASQYDQKIVSTQDAIQKTARQNQRYVAEQSINQIPNNTAEKSYARSQMYKDLYSQAVADGDLTAANQYLANYQQELTNAETQAVSEQNKQNKQNILDAFGSLENAYHDAKIDEKTYLEELAKLQGQVDDTGDYGLIHKFDTVVDRISKIQAKGGANRGTTASGLPYIAKGTGGSGTGGTLTNYDVEDNTYSDDMRILQQLLQSKKITQEEYVQQYNVLLVGGTAPDGTAVKGYANQLAQRQSALEALFASNPSAKIGKKKVADLLNETQKQIDGLDYQTSALREDDAAMIEIAPKAFNAQGDPIAQPDARPRYTIMRFSDMNNTGNWVSDDQGIYHKTPERKLATGEQDYIDPKTDEYIDRNGARIQVRRDKNGDVYVPDGNVRVYNPSNSQYAEVSSRTKAGIAPEAFAKSKQFRDIKDQKEKDKVLSDYKLNYEQTVVPSWGATQSMTEQDAELEKRASMASARVAADIEAKKAEGALPDAVASEDAVRAKQFQIASEKFHAGLGKKTGVSGLVNNKGIQVQVPKSQQAKPVDINQAISSGGLTMDKVQPVKPVTPVATQSATVKPISTTISTQSAGLTKPISGLTGSVPSNVTFTKAPAVNIGTAIKSGGLTFDKPKAAVKQPSLLDQGIKAVKNIGTSIFNLFNQKRK